MIQVFEMATRSVLRQYKGHSKAVHTCLWSTDGQLLASGSDDTTVSIMPNTLAPAAMVNPLIPRDFFR